LNILLYPFGFAIFCHWHSLGATLGKKNILRNSVLKFEILQIVTLERSPRLRGDGRRLADRGVSRMEIILNFLIDSYISAISTA